MMRLANQFLARKGRDGGGATGQGRTQFFPLRICNDFFRVLETCG